MSKISIKNIAHAIYESKAQAKDVVKFLNRNKLLGKSEEILQELEKIENKEKGIMKMKVHSAAKVPAEKRKELETKIKEKYKAKEIVSEYFEDKYLLGGMKIQVGEEVMDMTHRNKLNQLSKHLLTSN